ncbi:hypothetical protein [Vibrio anguillarum]|uniref:hypothetical protein n=1 Tax=Vibrio anguillarum TaxID=55601 RepID=UPI0018FE4B1F|nr:hypothetical protein [Vibrio anguillarum]MBF4425391.1 hypothetical protein [Vibrio anguillarum]
MFPNIPSSAACNRIASPVATAENKLPLTVKSVTHKHVQCIPLLDTSPTAAVHSEASAPTKGRDVVILNPYMSGGGDHTLANRISRIVVEEGGRASIIPINVDRSSIDQYRNISSSFNSHDIKEFIDPIFIVCPVGILPTDKLSMVIDHVCGRFNFAKGKVLLLEEMDLLARCSQSLEARKDMLDAKGFSDVQTYKLGFAEGAIGYLPVDNDTVNKVKDRADAEIAKLLDGYNIDIQKDSNIHLAYISDNTQVTSAQVFISNTLTDTKGDSVDSNYIIVFRCYDNNIPKDLKGVFGIKSAELGLDNPSLFGKASISYLNSKSGNLKPLFKLNGKGKRNVNIVLTLSLPKNIFLDLMLLSKSSMASGDQSLSEYISFKGEFPYYNVQPWKDPLVAGVKKMAESYGNIGLTNKIDEMVVGREPTGRAITYKFAPNVDNTPSQNLDQKQAWDSLNDKLSSMRADVQIRDFLSINRHSDSQITR